MTLLRSIGVGLIVAVFIALESVIIVSTLVWAFWTLRGVWRRLRSM